MAENIRGKFLWHELMTSDTGVGRGLLRQGRRLEGEGVGAGPVLQDVDDRRRGMGGLMPQRVEPGQTSPLQWFTYIGTPNVDATVRQAVELGGRVMRPAWDIPNVGRIAFLQDPQGAAFAVITPQPSSPPPPADQKRRSRRFFLARADHDELAGGVGLSIRSSSAGKKRARWKWDRARPIRCSA